MTISTHSLKTTTWRMDFGLGLRDGGADHSVGAPGSPEAQAAIDRAVAKLTNPRARKAAKQPPLIGKAVPRAEGGGT